MNPTLAATWSKAEAMAGETFAAAAVQVEEIGVATEIDKYGDAALEAVIRAFQLIRQADNLPDALNLALVGLHHAGELRRLDRLEEGHWREPILREAAAIDGNGRALVILAEKQLGVQSPAGVNGEVSR